jgi:hypothetical protein
VIGDVVTPIGGALHCARPAEAQFDVWNCVQVWRSERRDAPKTQVSSSSRCGMPPSNEDAMQRPPYGDDMRLAIGYRPREALISNSENSVLYLVDQGAVHGN